MILKMIRFLIRVFVLLRLGGSDAPFIVSGYLSLSEKLVGLVKNMFNDIDEIADAVKTNKKHKYRRIKK